MSKFDESNSHLIRAEKTIPLGSQTFSKSRTQYPVGISPLFAAKVKGPHLWDVDGNKYIDLVSSLAAITLGYNDPGVNKAVSKQLKNAVGMSLPAVLEADVSELLVELVPSAEMVRFGKNGTDATSAAIRLARAYTGRDHVLVCGYFGWQDWSIGSTTRNKGVPDAVSSLTHKFEFNNLNSLSSLFSQLESKVAAVILEPMNVAYPDHGYLEAVKELAHSKGALLIFDETITGFRFSTGGAQELFGVIPDISTFGKGIANGYPISAVVGRKDVMMEMEEIFFSGTFGGELLSLAAAKHVMGRHKNENISRELELIGAELEALTNRAIEETGISDMLSLSGHPSWKFLNWRATSEFSIEEIKTYFMQLIFERGLLLLGTHNVTLAHKQKVVKKISEIYGEVFEIMKDKIEKGTLRSELKVEPLKPLFRVR
jgi:glutamate-1-semialdehyde 2,1-aminomutase